MGRKPRVDRSPEEKWGIRRRVIGRLFMGDADGFAPGIGVVGVDVFVLGEGQDLDERLAEIGEGGGRFWVSPNLGRQRRRGVRGRS